jgi:hypothetical protein
MLPPDCNIVQGEKWLINAVMGFLGIKKSLTLVVPHPEQVTTIPAGGSNSEVGGGRLMALAEGTLRSKGASNWKSHNTTSLYFVP